jgi:hypothetical protein
MTPTDVTGTLGTGSAAAGCRAVRMASTLATVLDHLPPKCVMWSCEPGRFWQKMQVVCKGTVRRVNWHYISSTKFPGFRGRLNPHRRFPVA